MGQALLSLLSWIFPAGRGADRQQQINVSWKWVQWKIIRQSEGEESTEGGGAGGAMLSRVVGKDLTDGWHLSRD